MNGDPVIPPPLDDDDDDVAWALQTAAVQWNREAFSEAVVWVRRAVDAAIAAGSAKRIQELNRLVAKVTEQARAAEAGSSAEGDQDEAEEIEEFEEIDVVVDVDDEDASPPFETAPGRKAFPPPRRGSARPPPPPRARREMPTEPQEPAPSDDAGAPPAAVAVGEATAVESADVPAPPASSDDAADSIRRSLMESEPPPPLVDEDAELLSAASLGLDGVASAELEETTVEIPTKELPQRQSSLPPVEGDPTMETRIEDIHGLRSSAPPSGRASSGPPRPSPVPTAARTDAPAGAPPLEETTVVDDVATGPPSEDTTVVEQLSEATAIEDVASFAATTGTLEDEGAPPSSDEAAEDVAPPAMGGGVGALLADTLASEEVEQGGGDTGVDDLLAETAPPSLDFDEEEGEDAVPGSSREAPQAAGAEAASAPEAGAVDAAVAEVSAEAAVPPVEEAVSSVAEGPVPELAVDTSVSTEALVEEAATSIVAEPSAEPAAGSEPPAESAAAEPEEPAAEALPSDRPSEEPMAESEPPMLRSEPPPSDEGLDLLSDSELPPPSAEDAASAPPAEGLVEPDAGAASEAEGPTEGSEEPERPAVDGVFLDEVRGFEDLPEDAQAELARVAEVQSLNLEEEVGSFAAALVTSGTVGIMPAIADIAAAVARPGDVVFTSGSLDDGIVLRVVALEDDTRVAYWKGEALDAAFADCPWVQDELREVADRLQALAGCTLGELGDRLDDSLRATVTDRLQVRYLESGDVIVEKGVAVPGLYIVGAGRLELVDGEEIVDELGPGDFVFPSSVTSAGAAPQTVRVGKGGALVLHASRSDAHELLLSVPPLLEILAG